jgi:UPF0755 protein
MRRRLKGNRLVIILLAVLALDLGAAVWASWSMVPAGSGEEVLVKIPQGLSSTQIADSLKARGVLKGTRLFRLALRLGDDNLKAGRYLFRKPQAPGKVLSKLRRGETEKTWLRIPEGLWMDETAGLIAQQLDLDSLKLSQEIRRPQAYNYEFLESARDLEGLLFPDSYAFEYPVREEDVLPRLLGRCDEVLRRLRASYSLEETGLTLREWIVLASIVEAETMLDSERERVAAVYRNRLALGMKLEADPTVIYGLGVRKKRLYYKHLEDDSPYNSYRNKGLPPGPICSPGERSLEAVLRADLSEPNLYFVARGDGGHFFSATFQEHLEKVDLVRNGRKPPSP